MSIKPICMSLCSSSESQNRPSPQTSLRPFQSSTSHPTISPHSPNGAPPPPLFPRYPPFPPFSPFFLLLATKRYLVLASMEARPRARLRPGSPYIVLCPAPLIQQCPYGFPFGTPLRRVSRQPAALSSQACRGVGWGGRHVNCVPYALHCWSGAGLDFTQAARRLCQTPLMCPPSAPQQLCIPSCCPSSRKRTWWKSGPAPATGPCVLLVWPGL